MPISLHGKSVFYFYALRNYKNPLVYKLKKCIDVQLQRPAPIALRQPPFDKSTLKCGIGLLSPDQHKTALSRKSGFDFRRRDGLCPEGLADATRHIESLSFFVFPLSWSAASSSYGAKRDAYAFDLNVDELFLNWA